MGLGSKIGTHLSCQLYGLKMVQRVALTAQLHGECSRKQEVCNTHIY